MKAKYLALAAALMSAASLTSCTQEEMTSVQPESSLPKVITISMAGETRAVMGEGNKPMWEVYVDDGAYESSGDYIEICGYNALGHDTAAYYVCTNAEAGEFTLWEGNGGWSYGEPVGTCIVRACMSGGYYFVDLDNLNIEMEQPGGYGFSPVPGNLDWTCMVGYTDDLTKCTLHNTMALLKITVPEDTDVIYLGLAKRSAWGVYSLEQNEWIEIYNDDDYYDSYWDYKIGDYEYGDHGITADDLKPLEAGVYYFPMIPQTITSGPEKPYCFKIYYTNQKWNLPEYQYTSPDDDFFTSKLKTGEITLEAGKIYDLGVLGVDF